MLNAEIDALFDGKLYQTEWNLRDRFGIPPFTTLDTRQGYWQDRKRERVLDIIACESSGDPNALNPEPTAHGHATGLLQHLEDFWPERVIAANAAGYTNGGDIWAAEDQIAVSAYLAYRTPQRFTHWVCNP